MAENFKNYVNYKHTKPRISTNSKDDKLKENHRKLYYNQIVKEKILNVARGGWEKRYTTYSGISITTDFLLEIIES